MAAKRHQMLNRTRYPTKWTTHPATDFLNSLCPCTEPPFPTFDWCSQDENARLKDACAVAFNNVRSSIQIGWMDVLRTCNLEEARVLLAIELRTLRFSKLAEKITRATFVEGDESIAGDGHVLVPPTGISDGKLTEALRKLRDKGLIGSLRASAHGKRDPSNVYFRAPGPELLKFFFDQVKCALRDDEGRLDEEATRLIRGLKRELHANCGELLGQPEDTTHQVGVPSAASCREATA